MSILESTLKFSKATKASFCDDSYLLASSICLSKSLFNEIHSFCLFSEEKLSHIAKEINNEKEMILHEDLRQNNSINDYTTNQADMIEIHLKNLTDLENKIKELKEKKIIHKEKADKN